MCLMMCQKVSLSKVSNVSKKSNKMRVVAYKPENGILDNIKNNEVMWKWNQVSILQDIVHREINLSWFAE